MKKFFTLIMLAVIFTFPGIVQAQYELRSIPLLMEPENTLRPDQVDLVRKNVHNYVKGLPLDPKDAKDFAKNPPRERIQANNGFELINCSNAPDGQHETWIAINPTDEKNIIATSNDSRYLVPSGKYKMPAFVTTDGGETWTETTTPSNMDIFVETPANQWALTIFDPGITFDSRGWAYYSYGYTQTVEEDKNENGVFVCVSKDKGLTWEGPYAVRVETGIGFLPFHDRYTIAADYFHTSPYRDNVYITWMNFDNFNPGIMFSKSNDGGENWTRMSYVPGGNLREGEQAPVPCVSKNGDIYVVFRAKGSTENQTVAKFVKSTDGGETWVGEAKAIQNVYNPGVKYLTRFVFEDKQNIRVSAIPEIAVDNSNGPRQGWIYVIQAGRETIQGKYGIYMAVSKDGGETWKSNIRIDDATERNDMMFPAIAVDDKTGAVMVFYYSSQNDPENKGIDGYIAYSQDGENFTNVRLTPETWYLTSTNDVAPQGSASNIYWGDYTSMAAKNGKFYPLFWMPEPVTGNFSRLDLFTSVLSLLPNPPENFRAKPDFENPGQIEISWIDPDGTSLGTDLGNFKMHLYRDNELLVEVDAGVQSYTDKGLESGKKYVYSLVAKSDLGYSDRVYAGAYAGGNPLAYAPELIAAKPADNGIMVEWRNPMYHVDSTVAGDIKTIEIYVNGEKATDVEGTLNAGDVMTELITLETEKFYDVTVRAITARGDSTYESLFSNEMMGYAGAPFAELDENFDNVSEMIPYFTDGWAITNVVSVSEPNSITDSPDDDYGEGENRLIFAPVVVNSENTTLHFDHIGIIDNTISDMGRVMITNNFGKSWKHPLWVQLDNYPEKWSKDITECEWVSETIDLTEFVGDTVFVQFQLVSNAFRNEDGWYIDNLGIDNRPVGVDDMPSVSFRTNIYPNPAENIASLSVDLSRPANVSIEVFNSYGLKIIDIPSADMTVGNSVFNFDLNDNASGSYYCRIKVDNQYQTIPFVIAR